MPDDAWIEIRYPQPVWTKTSNGSSPARRSPDTSSTTFEGTRHEVTARLIVRGVPDLDNSKVHD